MLRLIFTASAIASADADARDLQRAKMKVPRSSWKASAERSMSDVLNGHLKKMFPHTKPCEQWTVEELQEYQKQLYAHRHVDFDQLYQGSFDNRRMVFASADDHQLHWTKLNSLAKTHDHLAEMHRDGHCHEAVMWLIHHVPAADQHSVFAKASIPLLPSKQHICKGDASDDEKTVCTSYKAHVTCAECHSESGIPEQDYNESHAILPEDPEHPGWARQRRCDQNFDPPCGACDGVGGPYWGDKVADFQPTNCEVVALPKDVPESERLKPEFAEQYIVHQLGSDRLIRTQNQARFALYSQIRSTLWYDFPLGGESNGTAPDGMAKLRHDSYYDDKSYAWLDKGLVTEIHFQNREQREANITGPMVSLIHGFLGWGKYLGGCTCVADPVGVPTLGGLVDVHKIAHGAFLEGADYLGRVTIGVEYDGFKMGDKGHGDMTKKRNMTVDHYIKWFLHLYVDADKSSPTYGQPVRFYGPYSGFAVYVQFQKVQPPAEVWDTACVDNGWGTSEFKPLKKCMGKKLSSYHCMNVEKKHPEICKPYEGTEETVIV